MSEATRLQNRIDRTQARLDAVSAQYDSILAAASSSNGDTSFSNQSLDAVGRERRSLEEELAELYRQQEALTGESGGGTSLPTFQSPSATTT